DARSRPSGENEHPRTHELWPLRTRTRRPVSTSHKRTVRSSPAVASRAPSGENAQLLMQDIRPISDLIGDLLSSSAASARSMIAPSELVMATVRPSGEMAQPDTQSGRPVKLTISAADETSHARTE